MKQNFSDRIYSFIAYIMVGIFAIVCIYPLLLVLGVSFSNEQLVNLHGYKLIPEKFSLDTYRYIFENGSSWLISSYTVTITVTILGTLACLIVTAGLAYPLALKNLKYKNIISFYCYFTMIFGAGIVPWYIICTKYYHLTNTMAALIAPFLVNGFFMFVLRSYFQAVPDALLESAKIDGANDFRIFWQIMLPISKTAMVTVGMFYALQFWNDWFLSLLYISDKKMYPLQLQLFNILSNTEGLTAQQAQAAAGHIVIPTETVKMATTVLTIGPIIFLYPFIQKYFVKGVTIGAVKG